VDGVASALLFLARALGGCELTNNQNGVPGQNVTRSPPAGSLFVVSPCVAPDSILTY